MENAFFLNLLQGEIADSSVMTAQEFKLAHSIMEMGKSLEPETRELLLDFHAYNDYNLYGLKHLVEFLGPKINERVLGIKSASSFSGTGSFPPHRGLLEEKNSSDA